MQPELAKIVKQLQGLRRTEIRNWLKMGELLSRGRDLLGNDDGFRVFLRQQCIPKTTAYKAMAAWRDFGDVPRSGKYSKEAMAILGQSIEARSDAIELSKKKKITARIARELVSKYIHPAPKENKPPSFDRIIDIEGGFVRLHGSVEIDNDEALRLLTLAARKVKGGLLRRVA